MLFFKPEIVLLSPIDRRTSEYNYLKMNLFIIWISIAITCYIAQGQSTNDVSFDFPRPIKNFHKISALTSKDSLASHHAEFLTSSIQSIFSTDLKTSLGKYYQNISQLHEYGQGNRSECLPDILTMFYQLTRGKMWAINMIDAWGKIPSGVLQGNIRWVGSYDECLSVTSEGQGLADYESNTTTVPPHHTIVGQYCSVVLGNNSPNHTASVYDFTVTVGLCLPRTCSAAEVASIVNVFFLTIHDIGVVSTSCSKGEKEPFSTGAIIVMVLLCIYGSVLILCTLYDIIVTFYLKRKSEESLPVNQPVDGVHSDEDNMSDNVVDGVSSQERVLLDDTETLVKPSGNLHKVAIALSLYSNGYSILQLDSTSDKSLGAMHGIRFLSMSWVILGHSIMMTTMNLGNPLFVLSFLKEFAAQAILNATTSVDTFFLLSGTLVAYLLLHEISVFEGSLWRFSWIKFYFHRFWRLTPMYMIVLAFFTTLFIYMGDGPFWNLGSEIGNCQKNWWTNLLYINNVVRMDDTCVGWTWYLANDMQFFLLSPLLILLLYRLPVVGYSVSVFLMIANSVTVAVITYVKKYPAEFPDMFFGNWDANKSAQWNKDIYRVPWCRYAPYVIGIVLGYIIFRTKRNLRIHWALVIVGWCVAAACNLSIIYGLYDAANGHPLSVGVAALYAGAHRTVWALGVAWVIFACVSGYGGFVNTILSWGPFIVLSRLTYSAYMIHILVLIWVSGNSRDIYFFSTISLVCRYLAHLILSYAAAFVVSVTVEAPFIALERAFLRNKKT